jgi:hypothetical protein
MQLIILLRELHSYTGNSMKLIQYLSWRKSGLGPEDRGTDTQTCLWKKYNRVVFSVMGVNTEPYFLY